MTFFFAGTDTTSSLLTTAFYFLGKYPEVQNELRKEVLDVVGNGIVEHHHLNKLKNITAFINETLRSKSPVPFSIIRYANKDTKINGMTFKKSN